MSKQTINNFWLVTNYSCNNRCSWCYTEPTKFNCKLMPLNYAKNVLKEIHENGAKKCTLIGGEPTLIPYLTDLIAYGKEIGLFMKIVTNGRMISKRSYLKKIKDAGISLIAISIHSGNPNIHNKITRTSSFDETLQGVKNCIKEKIDFVTLTTINKINKNDIFETAKFLNDVGVKKIIFNIAAPGMDDGGITEFVLAPDIIAKTITKNYKLLKKEGIRAEFYATTPLCLYKKKDLQDMIHNSYLMSLSKGGCNIFDGSGFGIDPFGNLIPCTHMVEDHLLGTMDKNNNFTYKGKFSKLWKKIDHRFGNQNWKYPSKKCLSCEYKSECIGGCPLFWRSFKPANYVKGFNNGK